MWSRYMVHESWPSCWMAPVSTLPFIFRSMLMSICLFSVKTWMIVVHHLNKAPHNCQHLDRTIHLAACNVQESFRLEEARHMFPASPTKNTNYWSYVFIKNAVGICFCSSAQRHSESKSEDQLTPWSQFSSTTVHMWWWRTACWPKERVE